MDWKLLSSKLTGSLSLTKTLETDCERLERRQMLSGNVTANISGSGDLVITGDNEANELTVEIADDGTVSIAGLNGTTVDLGNLATEKVQRDIRITLRGGDDVLNLVGTDASVPVRTIRIDSGSGNDNVTAGYLVGVQQDLVISTGSGDDNVLVEYSGIARDLTINGRSGMNDLRVENTNVGDENAEIRGDLRVSSRSGDDQIHLVQNSVYGNIDLRSGGGDDIVDVTDSEAMYGGNFNIRSGSGNDQVFMNASGSSSSPGSGKYGPVTLNAGSGDDYVDVSNMAEGQLRVIGGNGDDEVKIADSTTDGMEFRLGGGDDLVDFETGNSISEGPFEINGNGGTDEVRDLGLVTSPIEANLISIETLSGTTSVA